MLTTGYFVSFWFFAVLYIWLEHQGMASSKATALLKALPAISAILFILTSGGFSGLFSLLLVGALVFCGLGDIAMEYDLLPGLGLFLFSHILFISNFLYHAFMGLTTAAIVGFIISFSFLMIYVGLYHHYLRIAEEPTKLLPAVDFYAIAISLTLSSSIMLWISSSTILGIIPVLGAGFFISSDSLIGIREFHHRFKYDEPATMITYYLAIFLLSLSSMLYPFH